MRSALVPISPLSDQTTMDVIFVHGLMGHHRESWTGAYDWAYWPKWLAETLPHLRVWSFDYPASATDWYGHSMSLLDRATNFAYCLACEDIGRFPTVFITHSLGGLLTKQMLRHLKDTAYSSAPPDPILESLAGVVFFATPHQGSFFADTASRFSMILRPSLPVQDLQRDDRHLTDLNTWFRVFASERKLVLKSFHETQATWNTGIVVEASSSDIGIPGLVSIPLDADHITICKFDSQDHPTYRSIVKFITERLADRRPSFAEATGTPGLSIHMGLDNAPVGYDGQLVPATSDTSLTYKVVRRDDSLRIFSDLPYATRFNHGGPVEALTWSVTPFNCAFPALDFKVANNSESVVLISEAEFAFEYSRPVAAPLLVFRDGRYLSICIENEGAGTARSAVLRFNCCATNDIPDFSANYRHEMAVGDIVTSAFADLSDIIAKLDSFYSPQTLQRIGAIAQTSGAISVAGEVTWADGTGMQRRSCLFHANVSVRRGGVGAAAPPSCLYDLRLKTNEDMYYESVPVSQEIRPGDTDRFQIVLFCDSPSHHRFTMKLLATTGEVFASPRIELEMFVPSSAKRLGRIKGE